jgi:transcriptional regulator with XRE-family HTH domain
MAKKFNELRARMSPDAQQRVHAKTEVLKQAMALNELRVAKQITQKQLAEILHINQAAVSKLERRADMYVSTLRNIVCAMGGHLEIYADFPDGKVRIEQFSEIEELESIGAGA